MVTWKHQLTDGSRMKGWKVFVTCFSWCNISFQPQNLSSMPKMLLTLQDSGYWRYLPTGGTYWCPGLGSTAAVGSLGVTRGAPLESWDITERLPPPSHLTREPGRANHISKHRAQTDEACVDEYFSFETLTKLICPKPVFLTGHLAPHRVLGINAFMFVHLSPQRY